MELTCRPLSKRSPDAPMRIVLDENFPVQLYRRLPGGRLRRRAIIDLGLRGMPDTEIRRRLASTCRAALPALTALSRTSEKVDTER